MTVAVEPDWLELEMVSAYHERTLAIDGGAAGEIDIDELKV